MQRHTLSPLIVALDVATADEALTIVERLGQDNLFVKVGFKLFCSEGPPLIKKLVSQGIDVFIDLKLHDIPNTVREGVKELAALGVRMITVHCAGGSAMLEAALDGAEEGASARRPLIVGVTQLTSTSQKVLNEEIGIPGSVEQAVSHYARLAERAGLDGVVCSVQEVPLIKASCGSSFLTVTPGIRPAGSTHDDQVRVSTPSDALKAGSDFLVVGRPIIKEDDPAQAYGAIWNEMRKAGLK